MQIIPATPYLSPEERKELLRKNDLRAALEISLHWGWIALAFTLTYIWPNPLTVIISLFILGGKQLACAILMHDSSHRALFNRVEIGDFVGQWLGAFPIFQDMKRYRPYHQRHHISTGLAEDPDVLLTRGYPTSKLSMFRKILRDLTGLTGAKAFIGLTLINLGYLEYNLGGKIVKISQKDRSLTDFIRTAVRNFSGPIAANLLLLGILTLLASPWLYLLWLGAYFTTFQFCLRIRSMAEHSMVADTTDPYRNTRTTYANWLERLLFAPYSVNYHVEHHMLMGVPSYNLPKMHRLLKERGFYEKGILEPNYWQVYKQSINND